MDVSKYILKQGIVDYAIEYCKYAEKSYTIPACVSKQGFLYIKITGSVCGLWICMLQVWKQWYNIVIQDGVQDGGTNSTIRTNYICFS